jgi:N-acetyldiaminopimelate deacetylase
MAIALGILTHFVHHPIDDHLLFLFQPAEEGPGGALPMLQSSAFQDWKPDAIFALHIAPEYPVGTVATRPGILFANTSEVNIQLIGNSGHAAMPHKANDMMIAAAQLVMQLQTIVSRNIDPLDAVILTLGKMIVGSKENIIAGKAEINGTIRSLSHENMQLVKDRIMQMTTGIGESFQCETAVDWGINYLQVDNDPEITHHFMNWVEQQENAQLIECREAMTGEDFGYFLEQIPGMMFWLGVDTPYGLHHSKIEPNEEAIPFAINLLTAYLRHYAQQKRQKEEPLLQ